MVKAMNSSPTATLTTESIEMAKRKERACTSGPTEKSTTESGLKDRKKVMAFGKEYMATAILDNGKEARPQAMVFTFGLMETDTRVNGLNPYDMEMAQISSVMVTFMLGSMLLESLMVLANTNGRMATRIQVISETE